VPRVEYIYSISSPVQSLSILRRLAGWDEEKTIAHLCQTPYANLHRAPGGHLPKPLLKPKRIDDVRALAVSLRDGGHDFHDLRRTASATDRCASAPAGHRPSAAEIRPEGENRPVPAVHTALVDVCYLSVYGSKAVTCERLHGTC
jgi:hypothetical protein